VADGVVRPVAFVVAPTLAAGEIIAALRQRLEPVFVPRRVVQVKSFRAKAPASSRCGRCANSRWRSSRPTTRRCRSRWRCPSTIRSFAGHFPGQPLLPGALVLAEVMEAIQRVPALVARLGAAPRSRRPSSWRRCGPGSTLSIELQPEAGAGRGVRFDVRCDGVVAVSGRWTPCKSPRDEAHRRRNARRQRGCADHPARRRRRAAGPRRPSAATCWRCASSA
jgi:hypothetical protein